VKQIRSSIRFPSGNLKGGLFTGDFERQVKEGSRNGAPLSTGALRGEPGGRGPLLETLRDMSRKALEMDHHSIWREGSYTEDSERHVREGSGNRACLV